MSVLPFSECQFGAWRGKRRRSTPGVLPSAFQTPAGVPEYAPEGLQIRLVRQTGCGAKGAGAYRIAHRTTDASDSATRLFIIGPSCQTADAAVYRGGTIRYPGATPGGHE